ncbi:tRNA-dihydrouridine synthase A, partial [Pseudomonas syringae pv. pisi str. 1704B]
PGARRFRQLLAVDIHKAENPMLLLDQAAAFLQGH